MGETASTWKTPLHSSDTEHEWQKRYESKGKGGPFRVSHAEGTFPVQRGNPLARLTKEDDLDADE